MKISNSKRELARIISENGGWREAANLALFGKVSGRCYMLKTDEWPEYDITIKGFYINTCDVVSDFHASPFTNWHQTILSREEYFHLYPAPGADGWIEWKGGECPVGGDAMVVCKVRTGKEFRNGKKIKASILRWRHTGGMADIIAYRLHKPEQAKPDYCESITRSIPESSDKPTIEQLAADYRNAKDYADRKQQEADAAKADAEAKLAELVAAGKALGLALSVTGAESKPERVIIDWRDLQVDDLIWYAGDDELSYGEYHVMGIEATNYEGYRTVLVNSGNGGHWIDTRAGWGFIRRP